MKKVHEGKFEILTTKQDAIYKFRQMQGNCREKIGEETPINFYCSEKGKIIISHPSSSHILSDNSTNLYADVLEQDGKTYVAFSTKFSKSNYALKLIFLAIYLIVAVFAVVNAENKAAVLWLLGIAFCALEIFVVAKEKNNSPKDSEIMIKELEKRVNAINLWDK